jgi:hypothetical protein
MSWFSFADVPETPQNFTVQMSTNWSDRGNAMEKMLGWRRQTRPAKRGLLSLPGAGHCGTPAFLSRPDATLHGAICTKFQGQVP